MAVHKNQTKFRNTNFLLVDMSKMMTFKIGSSLFCIFGFKSEVMIYIEERKMKKAKLKSFHAKS